MTGLSPCASNSRWQNVRAKWPRLSARRSGSRMNAPRSLVSVKIMTLFQTSGLSGSAGRGECHVVVQSAARVPELPRRGAALVQLLEALLVLQGVHRRPEALVALGEHLAVEHQARERLV